VKLVNYEIEVVAESCTGCYYCERACPTAAITMVGPRKEALAVVDNSRCIACMRCIDSCDDDAMFARERAEPFEIGFDLSSADPVAVRDLCRAAQLDLEQLVCVCSGSPAKEVAAAILAGATTFEDLALETGVQSGCLMYCSVPIRRLLTAHHGSAEATSKVRRYPVTLALLEVPASVGAAYPLFELEKEQAARRAALDELEAEL
jgi:ferredoxin/bacterioferritin-associated ferredoxin